MKELRIGLVLYGGVSLAVYINGVTTEIWNALRASQSLRSGGGGKASGTTGSPRGSSKDDDLPPVAQAYRELLSALEKHSNSKLRIVVDAVAGTSAGGLNGAALAKAIVEGSHAAILNEVWIEQADIAALKSNPAPAPLALRLALPSRFQGAGVISSKIRDLRRKVEELPGIGWRWARDTAWTFFHTKDGNVSPLNGRYFSQMIARAFKRMGESKGPALLPDRGTFDLFLTRTDLYGWPRHLPLSSDFHETPVFERHHAHVMSFNRRPKAKKLDPLDDFDLTFAARTTAGFPGAFAPVAFQNVAADFRMVYKGEPEPRLDNFVKRHLREHHLESFPVGCTWMVDGGVLDNKPFTQLAAAIEDKPADHEVYRVVAYVEPDPTSNREGESDDWPPKECPKPLKVLQRLYGVVRSEPIYEDLRRLDARNSKVERLQDIRDAAWEQAVRRAEQAGRKAGLDWPIRLDQLDQWREKVNEATAEAEIPGYPAYVRLKARRAAAVAAGAICEALNHPYHSRHGYFIRKLVRAWVSQKGLLGEISPKEGGDHAIGAAQREFLEAFDLPFRLRRVRTLVQAINQCYGGDPEVSDRTPADESSREKLDKAKTILADLAFGLEAAYRADAAIKAHLETAFDLSGDEIDHAIWELAHSEKEAVTRFEPKLGAFYNAWRGELAAEAEQLNQCIDAALAELPPWAQTPVAKALIAFPVLDVLLFPMMDMADVTDLFTVRTMRFSPDDRSMLAGKAEKLKGAELGAFAGFLKRSSRDHDLLMGRLDGAERLIELIFKASIPKEQDRMKLSHVQRDFTRRAMLAIIDEERNRPGTSIAELASRFRKHLQAQAAGGPAVA